jgi:hypothetical protein
MIHSPTANVGLKGIYGMVTAPFAYRFQIIGVNYSDPFVYGNCIYVLIEFCFAIPVRLSMCLQLMPQSLETSHFVD